MTLLDLIEKDIEWIEAFYEEFYKNNKWHDLENFTQFLKEVFMQNVKKEYSICSMPLEIPYETTNYIFIFASNDYLEEKYVLQLCECSCGWMGCCESNWTHTKTILKEKLGKVKIDFWGEDK